jgi:hypothetical protein
MIGAEGAHLSQQLRADRGLRGSVMIGRRKSGGLRFDQGELSMDLKNWLNALASGFPEGPRRSSRRRRGPTGTQVQPLETRSLLSATPVGPEFRVNTFTSSTQFTPEVAVNADGDFAISWMSGGNQDGSSYGVYARKYNASGVPLHSGELRVNSITSPGQLSPNIVMDSHVQFVSSSQSNGQDGSGYGINTQRFSKSGSPQYILITGMSVSIS